MDFYRKCAFETTAIQKYGVRRWICVLSAPKSLDQITDEERTALFPVVLSEHNPEWKTWFANEKERLVMLVGTENIVRLSHIGSTSVPGLIAKPTVDILLEIADDADIDRLIVSLPSPEYICLNPPTMPTPPPHLMFLKGYTPTGFAERVSPCDEEAIMRYKNKLCHMHMHDAKGKGDHLTLGTGELDLLKYFYLANKYNCRVVLETKTISGLRASIEWIKSRKPAI